MKSKYSWKLPGQLLVTRPSAVTYQLEQVAQTLPGSRSPSQRWPDGTGRTSCRSEMGAAMPR
jgi:hypothetical protein